MIGAWFLAFTAWASPMPTVTMHDQWLAGRPLTLSIRYHNATGDPRAVPDLSNRPWLVKFDTIDPEMDNYLSEAALEEALETDMEIRSFVQRLNKRAHSAWSPFSY